jgi:dCMP deaminase
MTEQERQKKWDLHFMNIALNEVAHWSKDPNKKVGCLIVSPDSRQFTMGYNGFPQGVDDDVSHLKDKISKNQLTVHAELNAILNARTNLTNWVLYVTEPPCIECVKALIQAGIVRVVCPPILTNSSWQENQQYAQSILAEVEIPVIIIYGRGEGD